jgi:hypothetical protein
MCKSVTLLIGLCGLIFLPPTAARAFHSDGGSQCDGCHGPYQKAADQSAVGSLSFPDSDNGKSFKMLRGTDPSSTCLRCHEEMMKVLSGDGSAYTPGGDFFWLTRSYSGSPGENHGHNVISWDYLLDEDRVRTMAPGDGSVSYRSSWLECTSCHDPHANIRVGTETMKNSEGAYRLLGGVGYEGGGLAAGIGFTNPAPVAKAYPAQRDYLPPETNKNHVAYGSGMSEWCSNCHSGLAGSGKHRHPAGEEAKLGRLAQLYDAYVTSGRMEGNHATAYDFLVPFEHGTDNLADLSTSSTAGPTPGSNVMCLTCHRAHASPFSSSGRWDFKSTLLAESAVLSTPEARHAYYGEEISRRYGPYQRSLCNKCHVKD